MSKTFYLHLGKTTQWPELPQTHPTSLTYDDVLLLPQISQVSSRKEVDLSTKFGPFKLKVPIVSAPMDTITGIEMARTLHQIGALAFMPRTENIQEQLEICNQLNKEKVQAVYSIGLKDAVKNAIKLKKNGAKAILLDVAHGGMQKVIDTAIAIKKNTKLFTITGNIANFSQAQEYKKNNIDCIRVGVGPGGLCTTRIITGSGFPQLAAIFETTQVGLPVIADGGIKKPADMAKAIAAGAQVVMIGSMFAGTTETPGEIIDGKKIVRGQASQSYMEDNGVIAADHRTAEGITTQVWVKGSVTRILSELIGGLKSALSYSNAKNISEFQKNAQFCLVSYSTVLENQAHINK